MYTIVLALDLNVRVWREMAEYAQLYVYAVLQRVRELCYPLFGGNRGPCLTLRRRIKSHLLFAGIIRSSPFSPR
jgi:hypothetical protein